MHNFNDINGEEEQIQCQNGNCLDNNNNILRHMSSDLKKRRGGLEYSGRANGNGESINIKYEVDTEGNKQLCSNPVKCFNCKWWLSFRANKNE